MRHRLLTADPEPERSTPQQSASLATPQAQLATQPVFWLDLQATRLRRDLKQQLRHQQVIIESVPIALMAPAQTVPVLTREQRSHRRLSWAERLARNALAETGIHWQVQLFGIASTVLEWLHSLHPRPVLIS
ncbi:hypothetical protein Q2T42_26340 [Leptolyngbya boryana CZ1]|uniref:Uncharacterized protein n=1 Tax=Leptolyngbya boryana CZ1 TaxID=3060204 RepID=A0AA96WSF9_LEPBY|nr:hypothetical protein [Leptolyngbya boryana]WNZ43235.1 hypothetical protein Q2T42_15360 [Leptolyngbya boryana CZ1]WNZ43369.1 hypothetical protein Q2T42_16080 [Leptolyngbya boryana CZ1]WNZ45312.1 hypothetical protein Q2T42_26340 [Leptolyngbya boryana CZ1]